MRLLRDFRLLLASTALAALSSSAAAHADVAALVEAWLASSHADRDSRSFTYWNKDGSVPENCAACHSEPGFIDFLGADGSAAGVVNKPAAINAVIGCAACHTSAAHALDSVTLPSGFAVHGLGPNATCTVCHAGRASGDAVAAATAGIDEDAVSPDLRFVNIHYGVAAAVMEGGDGRAGFHYPDRRYVGRFRHVPGADTCVACHDAHTTQVAPDGCLACHRGVDELTSIRTRHADFDGDGDIAGGVHAEIVGLHRQLHEAIQAYAAEVAGAPIGYAEDVFPYFFHDTDGDGVIGESEAVPGNRYARWTPRLLKAAYNYQVVAKDRGGYTHNPAYLLQLLHDSLESLSVRIAVDMRALSRP
ncbi:MAG: polyheme membrane-associated cytochrome C [Rhodobacteraceae bacterium]|nr:MAG: polyheme membrane-associated cytochrome C [Paracoccaceae bacterium]